MAFQSPLRYPGGKSRLTYFIREIIKSNRLENGTYIEPFAGGAGIAVNLLLEGTVSKVALNDADASIYYFWKTVKDYSDELCELIRDTEISVDEWDRQKDIQRNKNRASILELGFSTLYLNRTNRSGILTGGMIGGRSQDGVYKMDARFNRERIIGIIEDIANRADDIDLSCTDAVMFLKESLSYYDIDSTLIYADPPYYMKGGLLYMNYFDEEDHKDLAAVMKELDHKWLLSYDDAPEIKDLYNWADVIEFGMNHTVHTNHIGRELFFSKKGLINQKSTIFPFKKKRDCSENSII